jgi:hypothetical protein
MPIDTTDIDFHLSGGSGNSDPEASLGGAISTTEITDASLANLFDHVKGQEATAGKTEYRCFYVKNNHGSLTLQDAKIWIHQVTDSTDDEIEIGLGTSAVNGTEQTIADEDTAPIGVTFSDAALDYDTGLEIGDIPAGEHKAVWVKRVVSASAAAHNTNSAIVSAGGDTAD